MTSASFIERVRDNGFIKSGSEEQRFMDIAAREAQRITAEINTGYHSQEELTELLSALTGREVDSSVRLFPPIYSVISTKRENCPKRRLRAFPITSLFSKNSWMKEKLSLQFLIKTGKMETESNPL